MNGHRVNLHPRTEAEVAVVIVNWNAGGMLARAVNALRHQSHPCRAIVVDNASSDTSLQDMSSQFPEVDVIHAGGNLGFAGGNNLAIRQLTGYEWIALLNPDAFPDGAWLANLMAAARARPEYSTFASRVVFDGDPRILDAAGDVYHLSGFAWRRGHGRAAASCSVDEEVLMASATAALYRNSALREAGGFDERYFCYYEDVDLGLRLQLLGHRSWYVASAVVHHVGSGITGKGSAFVARHTQRNRIWTYVKNMPAPWLWLLLPLHAIYQLLGLARYASQGQLPAALLGTREALRGLAPFWRSRQIVQSTRRTGTCALLRRMRWGLLGPLLRR